MRFNRFLIVVAAVGQFNVALYATGEVADGDADIEALKQQIQELDRKVRILERQRELDQETSMAPAKAAPWLAAGANGFSFSSADTNFVIALHGLVQLDSRTFFADGGIPGNDGFILRRARPIVSGTVYHDFDFLLVPDFGGSAPVIQDAYVNYRFRPELQLQAGKFKSPIGLEYLQSDVNLMFNERSLVNDLMPGRDLGVELHGDLYGGRAGYAAGIFNGVADEVNTANSDFNDSKEFAGRLFFQPFKKSDTEALRGIGFGVDGSYGSNHGTAANNGLTSGYTTDGQQKFFVYNAGFLPTGRTGGSRRRVIIITVRSACWGNMRCHRRRLFQEQRPERLAIVRGKSPGRGC